MTRRWLRPAVAAAIGLVVLVGTANVAVLLATRDALTGVDRAPHAQAAIVLGARVFPGGRLSAMLADRVAVASALYRAGAVEKIIVSGDHGAHAYDEPGSMRDVLLAGGVPAQDVFTDHAGFDTWATMRRAHEVFGVRTAIVVTQGFHLPRAVYLARAAGWTPMAWPVTCARTGGPASTPRPVRYRPGSPRSARRWRTCRCCSARRSRSPATAAPAGARARDEHRAPSPPTPLSAAGTGRAGCPTWLPQ